ncbi:sensor histidine kinase [Streptacidiphilus sp. PAMC 29251]
MSRQLPDAARAVAGVDPVVASAALCRAVLLGRAAFALTAAGAGLLLVEQRWRVVAVLLVTAVATVAELSVLTRWPGVLRRPVPVVAVDALPAVAVLLLSNGGMAYFCCAAGSTALAGTLAGMRALPWWALHAAVGFAVAAELARRFDPAPDVVAFVMALPMTLVLAGIGGAVARSALVRSMDLVVEAVGAAQASAAASERSLLARELHDSVAKTLRGVSFAALALPASMRRSEGLAEQLADTVSRGAEAASREARLLVQGLREDEPDRPFAETLERVCRSWSAVSGVPATVSLQGADPALEVRYQSARILQEALENVHRHARAARVEVRFAHTAGTAELTVVDDGVGCGAPRDPRELQAAGHFGIMGMAERAAAIGGTVLVEPGRWVGTRVTLRVPPAGPPSPVPGGRGRGSGRRP